MSKFLIILVGIVTIISVTYYFIFYKNIIPQSNVSQTNEVTPNLTQAPEEIKTVNKDTATEFLTKITSVGEDNYIYKIDAKKVGKVSTGKYKGYDRIILSLNSEHFKENFYFLFITKDYQNFISNTNFEEYPSKAFKPSFKEGVSLKLDSIPSNFPNEIAINKNFTLVSNSNDRYLYVEKESMLNESSGNNQFKVKEGKWKEYDALISENNATIYLNDSGLYTRYYVIPKFSSGAKFNRITFPDTVVGSGRVEENLKFDKPLKENYSYTSYDLPYWSNISLSYYEKVDLNDSDVSLITNKYGVEIYEIKNKDSKIYQQLVTAYKDRTLLNKNIDDKDKQNVFNDNISKGAILFIKSPLGGYFYLYENQDTGRFLGGGKPVIYLYPEKDTKVTIKFNKQMLFSNVVPNYENSWNVMASPNGNLKDLKPELTKCSNIKITRSTIYAVDACESNNYPYLYWSGAVFNSIEFPKQKSGFIVKKEELSLFFDEKLGLIGFNQKEISDFKEFWMPELISKNKNYYTISFLQNEELNALFPINVTPRPDSQIRIFMDWYGYEEAPLLPQQKLITYPRNGFTLTEWGGYLKK